MCPLGSFPVSCSGSKGCLVVRLAGCSIRVLGDVHFHSLHTALGTIPVRSLAGKQAAGWLEQMSCELRWMDTGMVSVGSGVGLAIRKKNSLPF